MSEAVMGIIKLWAQSIQIEISNEQKELVLISTAFGVASAYRQGQQAVKTVEVKNARLETAKKQLKDTEALYVYGKISKSDKLAIEVDYNNAVIEATTAKNDLQKSLLSLKRLLAIDDDEALELDVLKDLSADAVKEIPTETQAISDAVKDRIDLSIAKHAVSGTDTQKWLMLKPYVPSTIVQTDWYWNFGKLSDFTPPNIQDLTLKLTWNFWDGGAAIADFHKTHLQARRYAIDLREKQLSVKSEAEQAVRDLALAKETLRLRDLGLEKAQEAYRGFETRFALGAVSVTELLFAENTLNQAKLDHLSATVGIDIAYMNLQKAMGKKRPVPL
jgi:outer membrane protein TolC